MTKTYEPIMSTTLSSSASTFSFSSIPQTFTDLVVVAWVKGLGSGGGLRLRVNNDSSSNYSTTYLYGTISSIGSYREQNQPVMATSWLNDVDSSGVLWVGNFMSYSKNDIYKTVLGSCIKNNSGTVDRTVSLWKVNSSITQITLAAGGSFPNYSFAADSSFTLYGIKAA